MRARDQQDTGSVLRRSHESGSRTLPQLAYQQDPIRESVKALGAKWTLLILRDLGFLKLNRFGQILRNNPGLTARVLSRRLANMQKEGLIKRVVQKDVVFYNLTPQGEDAVFILLALLRYGMRHHSTHRRIKQFPSLQEMMQDFEKQWK